MVLCTKVKPSHVSLRERVVFLYSFVILRVPGTREKLKPSKS